MKCSIYIRLRRLLSLQTIGFLPGYIVMLAVNCMADKYVIALSLGLALFSFLILTIRQAGRYISTHMLGVSAVTLLAFCTGKCIVPRLGSDTEIILLVLLYIVVLGSVQARLLRNKSFLPQRFFSSLGNEFEIETFVKFSKAYIYGFSFYLTILVIYYAEGRTSYPETFRFFYCYFNQILILLFLVWDIVNGVIMIGNSMDNGIWLPVLDINLNISEYVTVEESLRAGKTYLHPHVRVIVMCGDKIYLQKSDNPDTVSEAAVDTPFSCDMKYKETIDSCIDQMLLGFSVFPHRDVQALLKTRFENDKLRRVVYLNVLKVEKEEEIDRIPGLKGVFWTAGQIEDNLKEQIFSTCFEEEYEFLKNTILLAYRYVNGEKLN